MSLCIPYDTERFRLPALMVKLVLRHPVFFDKSLPCDGKLDLGASISTIPETKRESLGLIQRGTATASGFKGPAQEEKVYYVDINFNNLNFKNVRTIATERSYALLGRDILNRMKLFADGKNKIFALEDP